MESFTRRVDAEDESEDTATQFSTISSDNGFASSSDKLRSEISSNNVHNDDEDEEVLSVESSGSVSPPPKRMAMFEGPEILKRLNVFEEVEHGDRVAFECQCKAHPMPVFKWYKDDSELVENDRFKIEDFLETDGTIRLIINSVRKSDEGAYRCKLENQEGVAASTGYLSVTGNSSSPNAVSTPPLLRAITEESNVSQDSDDGATSSSSVTLEKILTGEYDVTTLPYSQYLELLKESGGGSRNPNADTISGLSTTENNGGSRTPTEDTPRADDVRNLRPDFAYDTHATAAGDDDVNSFDDQHPITMATDDVETDAEHFVNKPRSEVIFGTPLLTDSQTVFFIEGSRRGVEVGGTAESSRDSDDRNLEEMSKEEGDVEFSLGGTRCGDTVNTTGFEADVEYDSRVHGESPKALLLHNSPGDFREEGDADSLDESRMKETVIAGRIGMPSDWEFAHYTAEADEVEEESPNSVPDEADVISRLAVETLGSRYMEEEVTVPEAETGTSSPLDRESFVPAAENVESREVLPREEELPRDSLLLGNGEEERGDKERILVGEGKEEVGVVPENSDDTAISSFLDVKSTRIIADEEDVTRLDIADVEDDFHFSPSDTRLLPEGSTSDVKEEAAQESKPQDQPEKDGAAKWMPEMTSISNVVSGVSTLINWNAGSAPPEEEVVVEAHKPEVAGSDGDEVIPPTTESTGFHFASLMSDLRPSAAAAAISDWIPNVSSYLPSLSPETLTNDGKPPTDVDEVVTEFVEPDAANEEELRSAIEWCIDWFRYPSIFYVLLVLTMTIVASATQMNPALVVLVVALCSIVGFRLFPVQK